MREIALTIPVLVVSVDKSTDRVSVAPTGREDEAMPVVTEVKVELEPMLQERSLSLSQ